jgi:beta-glucuronidase
MSTRVSRVPVCVALAALALGSMLAACAPAARPGSLPPTLGVESVDGVPIAMQNGMPVPTFEPQLRETIQLDGEWRVQRVTPNSDVSLTDRGTSLPQIVAEAAGREAVDYDDDAWETLEVPGALNPPPTDRRETGAWYRRSFFVPEGWLGLAATLKAEAINYLADVWVNGTWVGYHEGGYTPFAFDLSALLVPGAQNVIAIRVDNPRWGTRNDIVPWGLTDWWNYGGITRPIRIEATPPLHVVRADATPHLDGVDVSVVLRNAPTVISVPQAPAGSGTASVSPPGSGLEAEPAEPSLQLDVLAARVTPENVGSPLASDLAVGAPLTSELRPLEPFDAGEVRRVDMGFLMGGADRWRPDRPALYVLRASVAGADGATDALTTTFGLRHVAVDEERPRLLLNGTPITFTGVGLHDERIEPSATESTKVAAHRITDVDELMEQLNHARQVNANLIRAGHAPPNPLLLRLADRMGFAIWEEIPLYHYSPLTYGIAMRRGIPQQMLAEMALRDMNHASVLFHGLSNESTGAAERRAALQELHDIDREIDGTRLTGQAAYGSQPADTTQEPLDVAGYTFYYGVFYGADAADGTARALEQARAAFPDKPILALEFGRWTDDQQALRQERIFRETFPAFARRSALVGGSVGAMVWWTLEDFTTMSPNIALERFGLFRPDGTRRPAAVAAADLFAADAGEGAAQEIESDARQIRASVSVSGPDLRLLGLLAYGLLTSLGTMSVILLLLVRSGGRARHGRPRAAP